MEGMKLLFTKTFKKLYKTLHVILLHKPQLWKTRDLGYRHVLTGKPSSVMSYH